MSRELALSLKIGATLASGFKSTFASAKREIGQLEAGAKRVGTKLGAAYKAQAARYKESGGTGLGSVAGFAGAAYAFAQPIKQAVEFESVMADVRKVLDISDASFKTMSGSLLDMSTRIPMTASGLGAIMAAAGQAGIAQNELLRFTEDAAKMGVAFDLSGEQAGAAMSGLRSIFSLTQDQVVSLGDAINFLSNNMDAKASDLLNVANRAGSTAKLFGLSGQQLNALGATFLALKTPPETAATGINAMLMKMATADKQNKSFQEGLERIGLSAESLKRAVATDGQAAIFMLLERIKESKDVMGNLSDLFGLEYADDIAKLVGSLDTYKNAIKLVADPTAFAGSMLKEYEQRAKTTENNLTILSGTTTKLGVTIGSMLLPKLTGC